MPQPEPLPPEPGSREQIMFRASLRFFPPVSSQASDGRMM
jgi:hypothetical protein